MNKFQLFSQLQKMTTDELVEFARLNGMSITAKEAKKLRSIFKDASLNWFISGIPKNVLEQTHSILGDKRYKKLMKLIA